MEQEDQAHSPSRKYENKVWLTMGIVALVVVSLFVFRAVFNLLLMVLAAALIAIYFHALGDLIQRRTKWHRKVCMAISVGGTLGLLSGFFYFAGDQLSAQAEAISGELPQVIQQIRQDVKEHDAGREAIAWITSDESQQRSREIIDQFFTSTFGVLGDLYVLIILALFFSTQPHIYRKGMVRLLPANAREEGKDVILKTGSMLGQWLKASLLAMLFVAIFTGAGLMVLGVPMALILALIAGLLNFIPNFGPLIALVPAALVAMLEGPGTVLHVVLLYIAVQVLESTLVRPPLQHKHIHMPPALLIVSQIGMGSMAGAWGVIMATPLVGIGIVLVEQLYIKRQDRGAKAGGGLRR